MANALRRRLHLPRHQRYPVWNAATLTATGAIVLVATLAATFFASDRPLVIRLEWTVAAVAAGLFALLLVVLYRGVRLRREKFEYPALPSHKEVFDSASGFDLSGVNLSSLDGDEFGCVGAIVVAVVSLFLFVLLIAALAMLWPVAYAAVALVAVGVWWVCYLALRRVFVYSKRCRGDLAKSTAYALLFTLVYTGWLFAALAAWHYLAASGA